MTEQGVAKAERFLGIDHLYRAENGTSSITCIQALKARVALQARRRLRRSIDGEVKIIDEFTGRMLEGRRWSEGLHQAIEAKEGVRVQEENQTLATITLQNYFRLYDKLSGMTGTALTEATEFIKIYKLPVVQIPTNRPMVRLDRNDQVYKTKEGKWSAVEREIAARHAAGQPVLVGTISVEVSELLSARLRRRGIEHTVLNAKPEYAEREGETIAEAGRLGAVTIATNMAGRGVDIKLGGNPEHRPSWNAQSSACAPATRATTSSSRTCCRRSRRASRETASACSRPAGSTSSAPSATSRAASTTSCADAPAARVTRRDALLPLRRGRPRSACSPATASTASSIASAASTSRATRSRSRRGCSPSRSRRRSARWRSSTTWRASTRSSTTT